MTRDELKLAIAKAHDPYAFLPEALFGGEDARKLQLERAEKSLTAIEAAVPGLADMLDGQATIMPNDPTPEIKHAIQSQLFLHHAYVQALASSPYKETT